MFSDNFLLNNLCWGLCCLYKPAVAAQVRWSVAAVELVRTSNPGKLRPQAWPAAAAAAVAAVAEEGESYHHGPRPQDQDQELPRHRLPNLWRVQRRETESSRGGPSVGCSWQEVSCLPSCWVTSWLEESATLCLHSLQVNCTTPSESDCKLSFPCHGTSWFWHQLQNTSFSFVHEAPAGCFNIVCADAVKITYMT